MMTSKSKNSEYRKHARRRHSPAQKGGGEFGRLRNLMRVARPALKKEEGARFRQGYGGDAGSSAHLLGRSPKDGGACAPPHPPNFVIRHYPASFHSIRWFSYAVAFCRGKTMASLEGSCGALPPTAVRVAFSWSQCGAGLPKSYFWGKISKGRRGLRPPHPPNFVIRHYPASFHQHSLVQLRRGVLPRQNDGEPGRFLRRSSA